MNENSTNSKYTIWLYNIKGTVYKYLIQAFPEEHFNIYSEINHISDFYQMKNMNLLDRPDVVICDLNSEISSDVINLLYNSSCTIARVTTENLDTLLDNTFELNDTEIEILEKVNKKYQTKKITKLEYSINKIIEKCQMANIGKVQNLVKKEDQETSKTINVEEELKSGKTFSEVTTDYLFKLADHLNTFITFKDFYTSGHCKRVAAYAEALGHYLKLSNKEIEELILAANLHDIGKIALPDAIINKTGKLDDLEYKLMQSHVKLGASILPDDKFSDLKDIVKAHHERYDGTGYPDGLKGNEIPFFAQILAIADSFDAMTSQRSYNKVKSAEEAFLDLQLHTKPYGVDGGLGVFYNPELVPKFIEVISNSNTIMTQLAEEKAMADLRYDYKEKQDKKKNDMDVQLSKKWRF